MSDTSDTPASALLVGATLGGKYKLVRLLGEGGMGAVYEATNANTGRRVAIKTLHAHLLAQASLRQRFLQEARAATQIEHPNVIDVLDLDVDAVLGLPFIVQEFLSGQTLAERLDATPSRRFGVEESLHLAVPIMGALVAAHALGIVHRDLKPENIFIVRDRSGADLPKVIDFGIAKLLAESEKSAGTRTGAMLGTPAYMSPEQAMGFTSTIDAQTDVWAVGVVLYKMLSGRLPYEAENASLTLGMIQYCDPVPLIERDPTLPKDLVAVISRALSKDRALRYPSMQAFLGDLLETGARSFGAPSSLALDPMRSFGAPSHIPETALDPPFATAPTQTLEATVVARVPSNPDAPVTFSARPSPRRDLRWLAMFIASFAVIALVAAVKFTRAIITPPRTSSSPAVATPAVAALPLAPTPDAVPTPVASTSSTTPTPVALVEPSAAPFVPPLEVPAPVEALAPIAPHTGRHQSAARPARPRTSPPARVARPPRLAVQPPPSTPPNGSLTPDREWQP